MCADGAAHGLVTQAGKMNGLSPEDMERNRNGQSTDPKAEAAGQFAEKDAKTRGHIETGNIEAVCAAG
jgi:hypothetical protein